VSGFLRDAHVISELVKPKSEAKVVEWVQATNKELLYLSVLTLGRSEREWRCSKIPLGGSNWKLVWSVAGGPLRRPHTCNR
jgi:predicted nucleic acid-binding protein